MERSIFVLPEFILFLSATVIFTILFVIIHETLKQMSIFQGPAAVIVAICVSLLSVIGLYRFFIVPNVTCEITANRCEINLDFILLPYAALALTVILILFLLFVGRISRNHRANRSCKEITRRMR